MTLDTAGLMFILCPVDVIGSFVTLKTSLREENKENEN
jgi:hypothetical protein